MKAYKILFLSILVFIFASCHEDLLNTLPKDRLASELFWQTEQDAIYASNGIYAVLGTQWRYASMDAYTDIAHFILQWRSESEIEKNTFNASNTAIADEWLYYYTLIQTSSSFLENVDLVKAMNDELKDRLKAEAKTLRAFAYINLAMLYGDVPLVTTNLNVEDVKSINRAPVNTIWDFISAELTSASMNLPLVQKEQGRVTKGVALGLKARAMLYAGRFGEAKSTAKSVMELGIYQINNSYRELFDYVGEKSSEIIFARQYSQNINSHSIFSFFTVNSLYTKQCQVVPTKPLVDAYLMQTTGLPIEDPSSGFDPKKPYINRDPRLYYTVYISGDLLPNGKILNTLPGNGTGDDITISAENVTPTGWYFKKYVSNADYKNPTNCGVNLIYLRYAEILLTYVEASIELGGAEINQDVLDALNKIRNRSDVMMPIVTTMSQSELKKIIRRERLVELAMEGHRLYDIRRWKIGENVIPGTVKGMTYEDAQNSEKLVTVELSGYVKEFKSDKHYLWPIPFRELELNKNLSQNPGY